MFEGQEKDKKENNIKGLQEFMVWLYKSSSEQEKAVIREEVRVVKNARKAS